MSQRYTLSLPDELKATLNSHPSRRDFKTETAFIKHIIETWLRTNSGQLLEKLNAHLTAPERQFISTKVQEEEYNYSVVKQFRKDAEPPRTLLEYTKQIYEAKRAVFKDLNLPPISELEKEL